MGRMVRIILSEVEQLGQSWDPMLKIFFNLCIRIVKLTEQRNCFVAHCVDDKDAEKIFDDKSIKTLLSIGPELKFPWSLKSARTVIIRKLDDNILNSSNKEIADELLEHNLWMQLYEL